MAIEPYDGTIGGVGFWEREGSGKMNFDRQGDPVGHRIYQILWGNQIAFGSELYGTSIAAGATTFRTAPHQFSALYPQLVAKHVDVSGLGFISADAVTGDIFYERAQFDVTYEMRTEEDNDGNEPYITVHREGSGEILTIPGHQFRINCGDSGDPDILLEQDQGVVIPTETITFTVHKSAKFGVVKEGLFLAMLGKINDAILFDQYAIGKLQFMGFSNTKIYNFDGSRLDNLTFTMEYTRFGWNNTVADCGETDGGKRVLSAVEIIPHPYYYGSFSVFFEDI